MKKSLEDRTVRTNNQATRYVCSVLRTVIIEDQRWFLDTDMKPAERVLIQAAMRRMSSDLKRKAQRLRP